jgi:hypothetical protein
VLLAACSAASTSSPISEQASPAATQSCATTMRAWLLDPGGAAFRSALTADAAVHAALATGNRAKAAEAARRLSSAASRAASFALPACSDGKSSYTVAMADWVTGARDAVNGKLAEASAEITSGARQIEAATALDALSPAALRLLAQRVPVPAAPTPTPVPTTPAPTAAPTTQAPPPPPATTPPANPAPPATSAAPAHCYPLSNEDTCYEPGEYCPKDDHGASGVAGNGEAITCEDNDGWRWEPA